MFSRPGERNLRKQFKLCVTHMAAQFVAPDNDVNSDQCHLFNIFRVVLNIYTGEKSSEYLLERLQNTQPLLISFVE